MKNPCVSSLCYDKALIRDFLWNFLKNFSFFFKCPHTVSFYYWFPFLYYFFIVSVLLYTFQIKPIFSKLMGALSTPSQPVKFINIFFKYNKLLSVIPQKAFFRKKFYPYVNFGFTVLFTMTLLEYPEFFFIDILNREGRDLQPIFVLLTLLFPTFPIQVQQAVANCLPPLCGAVKSEAPELIKSLLNKVRV